MYSQNQLSKIHPAFLLPIDEFQKSSGLSRLLEYERRPRRHSVARPMHDTERIVPTKTICLLKRIVLKFVYG